MLRGEKENKSPYHHRRRLTTTTSQHHGHKVHERSVDTDLLCLFAKRLVETHPTLRLIVMSATLSANLLSSYYGLDSPPLFVGARRFPVRQEGVDRRVFSPWSACLEVTRADSPFPLAQRPNLESRSHLEKMVPRYGLTPNMSTNSTKDKLFLSVVYVWADLGTRLSFLDLSSNVFRTQLHIPLGVGPASQRPWVICSFFTAT